MYKVQTQFLANFGAPHSFDSSSESEVVGTFRVFLSHFDLEETPQVRFMSPGGSSRLHHSSSALYTLQSNVNRKSNESNKSYILRLKSKKSLKLILVSSVSMRIPWRLGTMKFLQFA